MKKILGAALVVATMGCRQVAGINPITYTGAEGGGPGCTNGTLVISTTDTLDTISIANGFVLAGIENPSAFTDSNVVVCPVGTTCTQPKGLLALAFNDQMQSFAAGSKIFYTLQQSTAGSGSVHGVGFDGTGDTVLLGSLGHPSWIATSGAKTFWVDDDQAGPGASAHCIGCGSGDMTWISNLDTTSGMFADANDVYVLADDGTGNATDAIYGCSVNTACGATPRTVIKGLSPTAAIPVQQMASDGTNVFVSNDTSAIIGVGPTGTQTPVVSGVSAAVITVDSATGELFYATDNGNVARVKSDGSAPPTTMGSCSQPNAVTAIAFDATNVYVILLDLNTQYTSVYAIKR